MKNYPRRMWINAPSPQQPCHEHHGKNVLAMEDGCHMARVFFTSGEVVSQRMDWSCLSEGWR